MTSETSAEPSKGTLTVAAALRRAAARLDGSDSPRLDAELLLAHALGRPRAYLFAHPQAPLPPAQAAAFEDLLARRQAGEPVAYLLGECELWSLTLRVTPDTLIPRPETEVLVEQALARIPPDAAWALADLGTGSGAIALALARERPRCQVTATDASPAALAVAAGNAQRLGLRNVTFRQGAWLGPLAGQRFHLIASNPPYVREHDPHLQQGDLRFEPRGALVGGADGLDAIRTLVADAPAHLWPGGWLLIEHGYDQREAVLALLRAGGLADLADYPDLAGQPRVAAGRLPDPADDRGGRSGEG